MALCRQTLFHLSYIANAPPMLFISEAPFMFLMCHKSVFLFLPLLPPPSFPLSGA